MSGNVISLLKGVRFNFKIITIFPELFDSFLSVGLVRKAVKKDIARFKFINVRDFSDDRYGSVDDYPYGGGAGMVLKVGPVVKAIESAGEGRRVLLTPQGRVFNQEIAVELSKAELLILICGRYEGFDERVRYFVDDELSIGDYIVHGGEVPAMVVVEAVLRLHPEFMSNRNSLDEESISSGLLEYPHYTRPREFRGLKVPSVLLSGNHSEIRRWRRIQSLIRTRLRRRDLFEKVTLTEEERIQLDSAIHGEKKER